MRYGLYLITALLAAGCVHESAQPLGNNMAQIDISASPVYGRAGTQRMAMEKAANTTLQMGYDKFIVISTNGWSETTVSGAHSGSFQGSATQTSSVISGSQNSGFSSFRHPESNLIIRMFKNGEKGSANAVDARQYLASIKGGL